MNAKTDIPAFDLKAFLEPLEAMGDSIVAVANGGIVKLHIHTFTPETVFVSVDDLMPQNCDFRANP
jgi:dihydroxyacetone kinase-like predicted kinase